MKNQKMYQLRKTLKKTQEEVAKAVGISQSSYAMIEGGRRHPRKEIQKRLAEYFGVTVDELFFDSRYHGSRFSTISDNVCRYHARQEVTERG